MKAIVQTYLEYLAARKSMGAMIEQALAGGKYLPDATVRDLAMAHAKFHECKAKQDETTKQWHFYDADGTRNNSARVQWDRNVRPYHKATTSKRGGKRFKSEKVAPDAQRTHALAAFKLLSAADRKWFLVQIASL